MTSTISRTLPTANSAAAALTIRNLANAAANDIEALQAGLAVNVMQPPYNAVPGGTTDATAAFNAALAANPVVYVPPFKFLVGNVLMNPGNALIGAGAIGAAYPGSSASLSATAKGPVLIGKAGSGRILNVDNAYPYMVQGLLIDGVSQVLNGIAQPTFGSKSAGTIKDCVVINCATAASINYGIIHAYQSSFGNCLTGILNPVDSMIADCDFAGNSNNGINCTSGSSSVSITGCRFEWNGAGGISLGDGTSTGLSNRIVITGNWFDRNGQAGILLTPATDVTITGNTFMRNGRGDTNLWGQCHIYIWSSARVTIAGNTTSLGVDDDGTGTISPRSAITFDSPPGTNVVITGNALTGYTVANITGTPPADLTTTAASHVNSGTKVITALSTTTGVVKGQRLTGTGIAVGNYVQTIDSASQVTCFLNNTATNTNVAVTFKGDYVQANNSL